MLGFFKWIFALLGLRFNFYGAVLGFLLGYIIDYYVTKYFWKPDGKSSNPANNLNGFVRNLAILTTAVMKADGKVIKGELDYVKAFFRQQFGDDTTKQALLYLRDILKCYLPVQQACIQIQMRVDYATRIHILHYLFGLSFSKGNIHFKELSMIESIANYLNISYPDFLSVKSTFVKSPKPQDIHWAYKTLEIKPDASGEEVKKAYRHMAIKYHPDKVGHRDEKQQKAAEEHFKKINNAFEEIKRLRGMK
ncbi:MAG: DnaJ domain-containing protein [Prevotellaceae bacterium]|jgi:DnaJ like chaperone protein|nr:DnaJ domain-containing protein [Prevotellaceae bacterium]